VVTAYEYHQTVMMLKRVIVAALCDKCEEFIVYFMGENFTKGLPKLPSMQHFSGWCRLCYQHAETETGLVQKK